MRLRLLLQWTTSIPALAWLLYFSGLVYDSTFFQIIAGILLILSVMSAVHHSEIIAHRVGEPYGTIILAVAVTIIEVSIIISLMVSGGSEAVTLARDTVYSATMLILNGIIGFCLFMGGLKYGEQKFSVHSATIALVSLVSIIIIALIIPSYTTSLNGPYYSIPQLVFASFACLLIYGFFLFAQTTKHRNYFLTSVEGESLETQKAHISNRVFISSILFLFVCLGIVVLLAKILSPTIEEVIVGYHLPKTLVGIVIASVILLPEGIAALLAAQANRLQTSLNLALGSALASIGLTIPCVAIVCMMYDMNIMLGLDIKSILLLGLSVFTVMLSLNSGRTNQIYGVVLLMNLFTFIFLIIHP